MPSRPGGTRERAASSWHAAAFLADERRGRRARELPDAKAREAMREHCSRVLDALVK